MVRLLSVVLLIAGSLTAFSQGSGFALRGATPNYLDCGPGMNDLDFPYTMEAWIKLAVMASEPRAIWDSGVDPGGNYYGSWIVVSAAGRVTIAYGDGTGPSASDRRSIFSDPFIPQGEWVHICGVQDGPLSGRIYFNGIEVSTTSSGTGGLSIVHFPTGQQTIGYHASIIGGAWLNGAIDEVRIWDVARSTAEIRASMCRRIDPASPGLAAYWRMDEGMGSMVSDLSGNGHDGSFAGPMTWELSGAPIGDTSTYVYPGSWAGESLEMPGPDATEQLLVDEVNSLVGDGVHLYRVDESPNTTVGLVPGTPNHYYGVFATDESSSYSITARLQGGSCGTCTLEWAGRNANDAGAWLPLAPGTFSASSCSRRLTGESSIGDGWRAEYAWADSVSAEAIILGNTTSMALCPGDSILFSGNWLSEVGIYVDTGLSSNGCDSVYGLELTQSFDCPDTCRWMLPNAFSPNGDGINDSYGFPDAACILEGPMQLDIYNRWGQLMYRAVNPQQHWDGTWKGRQQEIGVYVWVLRYRSPEANAFTQQQGTVTLVR